MIVQKRNLKGCEVAVIIVEPSDAPPVRFRGRTYIRVGPRRAIATQEEERCLTEKRRYKNLSPDLQPMPFASLEDLDLDLFRGTYIPSALPTDILEQNGRPVEQQLKAMRFTTIEQPPCPTILGLLVKGRCDLNRSWP
jgi:ATP-dependent DNA helicase RecG